MLFTLLFVILLTMLCVYKVDCGLPVAVDAPVRLAGVWSRCHRMSAAFKSAFPVQGSWITYSSVVGRFALHATGHRVVLLSELACPVEFLLQSRCSDLAHVVQLAQWVTCRMTHALVETAGSLSSA